MKLVYDTPIIIEPKKTATHTVIWLHGLGASGEDFVPIAPMLSLEYTRFIFPHAPVRPITINAGYQMRGWYDLYSLDKTAKQDEQGIIESKKYLEELIKQQIDHGIASENTWLFGFSQGGAVALYTALMGQFKLGGVVALSTYLPLAQQVLKEAKHKNIPIWMVHGTFDEIIPLDFAQVSKQHLDTLTSVLEFKTYPLGHSINEQLIADLKAYLQSHHLV